jgi:IclR family acetate operon transcriptional repressor
MESHQYRAEVLRAAADLAVHTADSADCVDAGACATPTPNITLIQSVRRALRLMEVVGESSRALSAKQLARKTGVALPTVYHLLRTLVYEGYLVKSEDGYALGVKIGELGSRGADRTDCLSRVRPILRSLRDAINAGVYFAVFEDGEIMLSEAICSASVHQVDLWAGVQAAGHATAFGKCILANLDAESRRDYLSSHDLVDLTPHTMTDRRSLDRRLLTAPVFADDREEYRLGTACIAFPVRTPEVVGAVAVSERASRFEVLLDQVDQIRRAASSVGRALAVGS